jgi:hypothetical protein
MKVVGRKIVEKKEIKGLGLDVISKEGVQIVF